MIDNERPGSNIARTLVHNLRNLIILEALPESEKREELILKVGTNFE